MVRKIDSIRLAISFGIPPIVIVLGGSKPEPQEARKR